MPQVAPRRAPSMLGLRGEPVVIGKQPDGDSIRFVPRSAELLAELRHAYRIRPSRVDGSVQLRLDDLPRDGDRVPVDDAVLRRTVNHALPTEGTAYLTLYESLEPSLRAVGRRRRAPGGVGARHHGRVLAGRPGLDRARGAAHPAQAVPALLGLPGHAVAARDAAALAADPRRSRAAEDDEILVGGRTPVPLSDLVDQRNRHIAFNAHLLEIVFIEK